MLFSKLVKFESVKKVKINDTNKINAILNFEK